MFREGGGSMSKRGSERHRGPTAGVLGPEICHFGELLFLMKETQYRGTCSLFLTSIAAVGKEVAGSFRSSR